MCEKAEEEQFQNLRTYIDKEPLAGIAEISEATGVSPKRILQYIREGRLQVTQGLLGELRCTKCGEPIDEGSFCNACTVKMAQDLAGVFDGQAPVTVAEDTKPRDIKKGVGFHTRKR
jgi:hypothetical protein